MVVLNTCHIREKAAEKVFSELAPRARWSARALRSAAACSSPWPAALPRPRGGAPGPRALRGHGRRPADLPPPSRAAGAPRRAQGARAVDTDFPVESKFDFCPGGGGRRVGLPVRAGGLRQVLHLLRRALHARGRAVLPPAARDPGARRAGWWRAAREITLLGQNVNAYHGERPDGSTWGLAHLIRALAEIDGLERIRYTTSHPRDMDEELIARPWRGAAADALPASAGAVGLGPVLAAMNRSTPRTSIAAWSRRCGARPGLGARPISSSASPARATRTSRRRSPWSRRSASPRPIPSSTAPARARRPRLRRQVAEEVKSERLAVLQELLDASSGVQPTCVGRAAGAARPAGPPRRPAGRPFALHAGGPRRGRQRCSARPRPGQIDRGPREQPRGCLAPAGSAQSQAAQRRAWWHCSPISTAQRPISSTTTPGAVAFRRAPPQPRAHRAEAR